MDSLSKAGGWIWTIVALVGSFGALGNGQGLPAFLLFLSSVAAMPPLWRVLREKGVRVPLAARVVSGVILAFAAPLTAPPRPSLQPSAQAGQSDAKARNAAASTQSGGRLAELEGKIAEDAVMQMDREGFSDTYNKLGRAQFENANRLMRWVAVAAAESEQCPQVEIVGISDSATRQALRWYVDCSNRERFMITEAQAVAARDRYDPSANPGARHRAQQAAIAAPQSARWAGFNEANAATACDLMTQQAMQNPRSFSTGWNTWDASRDDATGRVTIERDFRADAALGRINSRYRCVVDAESGNVVSLAVREVSGWRQLH